MTYDRRQYAIGVRVIFAPIIMQRLALGNYMPGVLVYCMSYFQVIMFEDSWADRAVVVLIEIPYPLLFPDSLLFPNFLSISL